MRKTDWAYLAAFIDADGCITVGSVYEYIYPWVTISQKLPKVLYKFQKDFGVGRIHTSGDGNRTTWKVCRKEHVKYILEGVLPYMVEKQERAMLALVMLNTKAGEREEMAIQLREMNH